MQLEKLKLHSLDEQRSVNMNVSMNPSSTRVAVVGGGPGGLSAAVGLVKLGYKHVTVLEQHETVGGMCASMVVDDRVYDLGGQVLARESCRAVMSIVREFDLQVEMEDMSHHRQAKIDLNTGRYEEFNLAADYVALIALTSELQAKATASGKLGIHAVSDVAHEPTPVFLRKKGFSELPKAIASTYTGSGYGFVEDIPYAYIHEFIRSSMLGKMWRVKGGYGGLWNKVAQNLPDVRCNMKVRSIDRSSNDVVRISVEQNSSSLQECVLEFDKVILSGSLAVPNSNRTYRSTLSAQDEKGEPMPREAADVLDYSEEEEQLFSKVQTIEYYTTAITISGLDLPPGFYLPECATDSSTMGHIVALQRFFGDTAVYLIWSYGNAQCDQQCVTELLHDDVRRMGGQVESVILQRKWVYYPHVTSQEMADGFYDKLDDLQGKRNTYYLGALLAFEHTERNSSFALDLVRRHFGPPGNHFDKTSTGLEIPQRHPVIQNLMPAPLDEQEAAAGYPTKKLKEIPGVSFPQLSSIDAYVSFYGGHKVLRDRIVYRWVNDKGEESDSLSFGQVDSRASIIAQRLVMGEAALEPGDRVLMLYQPGLEFIEAFFGCLRARILPVPIIPPDPTKPYDQALVKVASVTKVSDAKAILSTALYHNAVRAAGWRKALFGQNAPPAKVATAVGPPPQWPDLPWHHTDSWTRGSIKDLSLMAWAARKANNGAAKKQIAVENYFSADDPVEMKAKTRNDPRVKKVGSSILGTCNNFTEFHECGPKNCAGSEPKPSDLCFLQFTSGSTGDPKGAMITHGALLHNVLYMKRSYNATSRTVCIQWLPQYHDMGLIGGILVAFVCGGCLVLFSPATFIRKPLLWLELIERYKGTHTAAPNFGFELVLKRYESLQSRPAALRKGHKKYNLSSLHFLMSAAEPIRPGTMRRFLELFYSSGLRESMLAMGYGLAENCLLISTSYGKCKPLLVDWDGRLCVGYARHGDPDMDVRIVNADTLEEQREGVEGEIWVCSPSNGVGYWGLPDLSKHTFANEISESSDSKTFLRTGDLGRVINGNIFVTGRIKDLIIIQGRNIYPSDIEKTVESCSDDVRPGCSAAISGSQKILKSKGGLHCLNSSEKDDELLDACVVVVAEVRDEKNLDANRELVSCIKSAVASEHGINVAYVDLIQPRSIPKTTSGKIRRRECLKRFSEGTLLSIKLPDFHSGSKGAQRRRLKNDIISRKKSRYYRTSSCSREDPIKSPRIQRTGNKEALVEFLVGLVAKRTRLSASQISVKEGLSNYSLTSLESVSMAQEISEYLGLHIPPLELYTARCIEELADNCLVFVQNSGLKWNPDTETSNYVDNHSKHWSHSPNTLEINESFEIELISDKELMLAIEPSVLQQLLVTGLQVLGLVFIAALLLIPAATIYGHVLSILSAHHDCRLMSTFLAITLVPAAWMFYIGVVGVTICVIGRTVLQPNYALQSAIPLWSTRYVRWWTFYRLQDFASKSLAVHLRGTVFLVWWYRLMGAQIGNNVRIDTTEITDPSLLYIGNGAVIEEDATLQSHDVRAGAVHFEPIKIGSRCVVESFSVVQRGTCMEAGSRIGTLCKTHPGQFLRPHKQRNSRVDSMEGVPTTLDLSSQLCGVYLQGLISTISALLAYAAFRSFRPKFLSTGAEESSEIQALAAEISSLFTLALTFPWALSIVAPITLLSRHDPALLFDILINLNTQLPALLLSLGASFVVYGVILGALTSAVKWCLIGNPTGGSDGSNHRLPIERIQSTTLISHGLLRSAHQKFFVLLMGTEALCIYLRNLGAKIGSSVSIRRVNALVDPDFLSLGDGCHLGDFSKLVSTKITRSDETNAMLMTSDVVRVGNGCLVGAQSVLLPGATMESESVLGAMSVAPDAMFLQEGGVYVGGREGNATVMISRQKNSVDLRVEGMDGICRQIVAKLATDIARTTITSTKNGRRELRFFHRVGVAGRGTLRVFDYFPGLPKDHEIFSPGRSYPVVLRHSNALSGTDDRCPDIKGAALRILHPNSPENVDLPLLDLVMKTGECFHARNILDLMSWDAKTRKAQEEYVVKNPRIGETFWGSIRTAESYTELHYYSVLARLFRSNPSRSAELSDSKSRSATEDPDYFVKFRLRPIDPKFDESYGSVVASASLPPQQGYLPPSPADTRSTQYLREEFKQRLQTKEGAKYILQLQKHRIPKAIEEVNDVLDPTVAWDEEDCPFVDIAELSLKTLIADEVAENMTFNSRNGGPSVAVVPAQSATDSASLDHCRSVIYDIAQTIRKGLPLHGAWRDLVKVEDLELDTKNLQEKTGTSGGCPMMSPLLNAQKLNEGQDRNNASSTLKLQMAIMKVVQSLLQAMLPIVLLVLSAYPIVVAMAYLASKAGQKRWIAMFPFMLPVAYVAAGVAFVMTSVCCRWVLLGRYQEGAASELWSWQTLGFTFWEAIMEVLRGTFLELVKGSLLYNAFLKLLGASIGRGVYIDSLNLLNPAQLRIGAGSAVGRNALFFGHLYEPGRKVFYKSNVVGDFCTVGTQALMLPGSQMDDGSDLGALELAMKDEVIASYQ